MGNIEALLMALAALAVGVTDFRHGPRAEQADGHNLESQLVAVYVEHDRDSRTGRVVRSVTFGFDPREAQAAQNPPIVIAEDYFNREGEPSERLRYRGRTWTWDVRLQANVERRMYEVVALADTSAPERFREVYLFDGRGEHIATERELP